MNEKTCKHGGVNDPDNNVPCLECFQAEVKLLDDWRLVQHFRVHIEALENSISTADGFPEVYSSRLQQEIHALEAEIASRKIEPRWPDEQAKITGVSKIEWD